MAFPFSVYNIAYPAAGFKSQTHVYCNVIAKAVCLLPYSLSDRLSRNIVSSIALLMKAVVLSPMLAACS